MNSVVKILKVNAYGDPKILGAQGSSYEKLIVSLGVTATVSIVEYESNKGHET